MVQNDQDGLSAIFEASEFLANLLARYANIEANYRKWPCTDSDQLERSIVDVYVAILQYSAAVKAAHQRSALSMGIFHNVIGNSAYFLLERVKESFLSLAGQPLQTLQDEIRRADNEVDQWKDLIENECK
jgi:hypothetical protein